MNLLRKIQGWMRALFRKGKLDHEMDEEMRFHVEMRTRRNMEAGMPLAEARCAALRSFGGVEQVKELCRDLRGVGWMESLWQDARLAVRMFRKIPGFTAAALGTIALGVGATTAIFGVVNAVLLRPMQFKDVDRLAMVWEEVKQSIGTFRSGDLFTVAPANFLDWRAQSKSFDQMVIIQNGTWTVGGAEGTLQVSGVKVSEGFFSLLGVRPLLGRAFAPDEARETGPSVIVLGHKLWQRHYGGAPDLLGKTVSLTDVGGTMRAYTVVGIMPASFDFPNKSELWLPYPLESINPTQRGGWSAEVVAKLKPGVSRAQAQSEMQVIADRLAKAYPGNRYFGVRITSLQEHLVRNVRPLLYIFQATVSLVFLMAAANVANLLLARSERRTREVAVRLALGASRRRITRQLLTEHLLLAVIGGAFGLLLAYFGLASFSKLMGVILPRMEEGVSMDARVLTVCLLLSLASGLIFGLAPVLRTRGTDLNECLKEGGDDRGFTRSRTSRPRNSVVIGEIALSLVLLVGAGLLLKSFIRLSEFRLGFQPANVLVVEGAVNQEMLAAVSRVPGVQAVAASDDLPMSRPNRVNELMVEGGPPGTDYPKPVVYEHFVTPGYFRAMGIPLVRGRTISEWDTETALPVVVVNEAFARRLLRGTDPIGQRLSADRHHTIVGVVGDVRQAATDPDVRPQVYYASRQERAGTKYLIVRTVSKPMLSAGSIRAAIDTVEKTQQPEAMQTMEDRIADSIIPQRFQTSLVVVFSLVGLLLALVGIWGTISYSVAQRVREFGIRMAVGAQRRDILHLVAQEALRLVAVGVGLGLLGAFATTQVLRSFLFQVGTIDPTTFGAVTLLLALVALLAAYVPAIRAASIDPSIALRHE